MKTVIEMAREAGLGEMGRRTGFVFFQPGTDGLERFAELVRADEREALNKERQQYADWLDEAAADIEDWGMYASEYLQEKWDLPGQVQDYKNRAATIRAKGQP